MQQEITLLGKNTTIDFFVNVYDSEPSGRDICDWRVNDFAKVIERQTQLHFAVERYTAPNLETKFEINRVQYHRISGHIEIVGYRGMLVKALRVDGSNYTNNELTEKATAILSDELRPILIEAYQHLDTCKVEAWNEMIGRIKNAATEARRRADELQTIADHYHKLESAVEVKWRTQDGKFHQSQAYARVRAIEAGQTVYFEDAYQIRGNILRNTIEHSTEIL